MHFSTAAICSVALLLLRVNATPVTATTTTAAPTTTTLTPVIPQLTYLFTASLKLGTYLAPIDLVQGGQQYIEPITSGNLTGPYVNGTVIPGMAAQKVYEKGKLFFLDIKVAGVTDDGFSFLVHETGVGSATNEWSQIVVEVGGKYEFLQTNFLVANIRPDFPNNLGHIDVFCVACVFET